MAEPNDKNKVELSGSLSFEPTTYNTPEGKKTVYLSLKITRIDHIASKEFVTFVKVRCGDKLSAQAEKLKKGDNLEIHGALAASKIKDTEHYQTIVQAFKIISLGKAEPQTVQPPALTDEELTLVF